MSTKFELHYSEEGLLSRVLYLASSTTLTIFVEDEDKEYEYEEIFEKILPEELKVNCIFPTGGKQNLEEAFMLFGDNKEYGRTFFIADGDFDVVLGKSMITATNFIYLKRYNIESYLLNENSILKYMRPRLRKTFNETKKIINYRKWVNELSAFYNKLFALHCVVQKYACHIENVGRKPDRFLDCNGFPKEEQFEIYREEIEPIIPNLSKEIDFMLKELTDTYGTDTSAFVCGKYYICALKLYLNTKLRKKINEDEVKAFLITELNTDELDYVKEQLLYYIAS